MKYIIALTLLVLVCQHVESSENLSFQRPTSMSEPLVDYNSDIVVDGVLDQTESTCIHTAWNSNEAWWQVRLADISIIKNVEIFYRESDTPFIQMKRLAGFSIYVSNSSRVLSGQRCYNNNGTSYPELYMNIPCEAVGRFLTIIVQRPPESPYSTSLCYSDQAVLELCEVEVFGCAVGFYGRDCTRSCPSGCVSSLCHPDTGDCMSGCTSDRIAGAKCTEECTDPSCEDYCPVNCANKKCNFMGNCLEGCEAGWKGELCQIPCGSEYFGANCNQRCYCDNGSCDSQNGTCPDSVCLPGWMPPSCSQLASLQTSPENTMSLTTFNVIIVFLVVVIIILVIAIVVLLKRQYSLKNVASLSGLEGLDKTDPSKPKQDKNGTSTADYLDLNSGKPSDVQQSTNKGNTYYLDPVNSKYVSESSNVHPSINKGNAYYLDPVNSKNVSEKNVEMNNYEMEEEEDYYTLAT